MNTFLIRRGNDIKDIVLEKGEIVYCFGTNSFYVGDGETSMRNLKQHNGIVKGDDGKVYIMNVDKNGEPHCTPYIMKDIFSNKLYELKCELKYNIMSKTERRDALVELGLEDSIVFENPDYDSAIIGYDENSGRIIYDYEKMIEHLMEADGIEYEEAMEFIDYNTVRACPYMGDKAPIILRSIEDYLDYSK